jgi:hypothetical protein
MTNDRVTRILQLVSIGDIDNATEHILMCADELTLDDVTRIMDAAKLTDPSESADAAQIRDAIRDNTDFDLI